MQGGRLGRVPQLDPQRIGRAQSQLLRQAGQPLDHFVVVVGDADAAQIGLGERAACERALPQPVDQATPVVAAVQDDRELREPPGLHERDRLEELVEGAHPTGQHDEAVGVLDQDHLAGEEVVKRDAAIDEAVGRLVAEVDRGADRDGTRVGGAAVRRLHQTGTAARDDVEAEACDALGELPRWLVVRMRFTESRRSRRT